MVCVDVIVCVGVLVGVLVDVLDGVVVLLGVRVRVFVGCAVRVSATLVLAAATTAASKVPVCAMYVAATCSALGPQAVTNIANNIKNAYLLTQQLING